MTSDGRSLRAARVLVGMACLTASISVGCGDDSPGPGGGGSGGSGGSSGAAGTATGSGGSSGSSGAGMSGSSGSGGEAGDAAAPDAHGGSGGSSGSGTDAGNPADAATGPKPTVIALSPTGHDRLFGVVHDATGNIYAAGSISSGTAANDDHAMLLVKFLPTGDRDPSFGTNGFVTHNVAVGTSGELARGIVVQSTGKIVIAGSVEHAGGDPRDRDVALVRFTAAGVIDASFGTAGVRILDLSSGEVPTADGGINIVAESTWGLSVFPNDDLIVSGARKADGRTDTDFALVRLKADGANDPSFGTVGVFSLDIGMASASPRTATILPDGSVVMAGYMSSGGVVSPVLFKVSPTGVLDPSFGVAGVFNQPVLAAATEAYGAALQGTSFVTNGYGRNTTSESLDFISLRVSATGVLDTTFATNGVARIDVAGFADNGRALAVLPDDRVLLVGGGRPSMNDVDGMLVMLTPNGQPDTTFAPSGYRLYDLGGPNDFFWGVSVAPDKKSVVLAGLKGASTTAGDAGPAGNDDAALLLLPLGP